MTKKIIFLGMSGYGYPHTRVRCYHFERELSQKPGIESEVLSYRDHLGPEFSEGDIYRLKDKDKLRLTGRAFRRLWKEKGALLYLQKAHFHAVPAVWLDWLARNPYVLDYDDYDVPLSNFFRRGAWNRLLFGEHRWDVLTEKIIRKARFCVAASHELIDYLKEHHEKVYYVPTGVDTTAFQPKDYSVPPGEPVVFFWNGLVWGEPILESLRLLLKAFSRAYAEVEGVTLKIIGGGDLWDALKEEIERDYPSLPISLEGWMDPKEMPAQLGRMDVGCLPLHGDSANRWLRSKSPTKMFEYMAAALPVVASAIGEPTHVIEDKRSGFLVRSEEEMAQQMIELAKNSALRREMGMEARKKVEEHFSLPVLGDRLYGIFSENGWVNKA
jgi:glycosyltransferase involved in cell wall biosynthesis